MSVDEERTIERRRSPRVETDGRTATIGFRERVRLLDLSVNGVQLSVPGDVTVGTRAWLTAVLGSEPLSVSVEVRRAILSPSGEENETAIGGELRCNVSDGVTVARFVTRGN